MSFMYKNRISELCKPVHFHSFQGHNDNSRYNIINVTQAAQAMIQCDNYHTSVCVTTSPDVVLNHRVVIELEMCINKVCV